MTPAVFLTILCLGVASAAPTPDYSLDAEWEEWKRSNEKTYSQGVESGLLWGPEVPFHDLCTYAAPLGQEEERQRRTVWEENMKMIKLHSEGNGLGMNNFTVEMNEFGDMTGEEMRKMMMESSVLTLRNGKRIQKRGDPKIPKTLDWRTQGYVTPVQR
ncbi:hypothetical protein A6R68_10237, partial [Neotoma lepida]